MYRFALLGLLLIAIKTQGLAQENTRNWYSESTTNGVTIQNSYPKGGHYTHDVAGKYYTSYLVFYSRVVNKSDSTLNFSVNFSADSIPIPNSPGTYMRLLLPAKEMTEQNQDLFSYGLTELDLSDKPGDFQKTLAPQEDCLFYVVAFFYQTNTGEWNQERGGNRAGLVLKGDELFYHMPPQVEMLRCGKVTFD